MKAKSRWRRIASWLSDRRVVGQPFCRMVARLTARSEGLNPEHEQIIREWAATIPYVREVWLFGSRAKGCASPRSDIDLVVTAGYEHIVALADDWGRDLTKRTGLCVHSNAVRPETVKVLLYEAPPEPEHITRPRSRR
jgi:predicted nucleotidyltransferase